VHVGLGVWLLHQLVLVLVLVLIGMLVGILDQV